MTTTVRTRLRGLTALVGLLAVLVGTPTVLIAIGATPFPDSVPTWTEAWATLTGVDDGTMALTLFRLAAWGAWAYLALGVLLEVAARARGIRAPRIHGLGLAQTTAHALVSAAVLAFTALPSLTAPAHATTAATVTLTQPDPAPTPPTATPRATPSTSTLAVTQAPAVVVHTVLPGETLWGIAEQHLGDGARFLQIAEANYARPQSDGRTLTPNHRIHPGWQLVIPDEPAPAPVYSPADATEYTVVPGDTLWDIAADHLGDPTRYPEIYTASVAITQPGGHHLNDPDEISPGWTLHIPAPPHTVTDPVEAPQPAAETPAATPPAEPTAATPDPSPAATAGQAEAATPSTEPAAAPLAAAGEDGDAGDAGDVRDVVGWPVRTTTGVGSLLAAGLIALLTTRRAMQSRHRRPGTALPVPTGPTGTTETQLRATADAFGVSAVDTALRTLATSCAEHRTPLPVLRYARLTGVQLDLHLAEPAQLPEPWTGTTDATVWTLRVEDADLLDPATAAQTPAPYPALVTLGHDNDDAHIFLDLEQVGSLAVDGEEERTRDVLAALAVELATSAWADDLQVTTVTAFPELEDALRTGRIRYLPSAGRVFEDLTTRAQGDRAALAEAGAPDLAHARTSDAAPEAWYPEIVLLATPLTARQRQQLDTLLDTLPRVAVAAVTTGTGAGEWTLTLTGDDDAVLAPLGMRLRPQRLDQATYRHILDLVSLTGTDPTEPYSTEPAAPDRRDDDPTAATPSAPSVDDPTPDLRPDTDQRERFVLPTPDRRDDAEHGTGRQDRAVLPNQNGQDDQTPHVDAPEDVAPGGNPMPATGDSAVTGAPEGHGQPAGAVERGTVHGDGHGARAATGAAAGDAVAPSGGHTAVEPPFVRVLGPVVVDGAQGSIDPTREAFATEFVAFLALNRRASAAALEEALWPTERINPNTRRTSTSRVRRWLGTTANGDPWLAPYKDRTGFVLDPAVRSDWDAWRETLPSGPLDAPTEMLEQALDLVRGRPFANATPKSYAWAEPVRAWMVAEIADACCELARRRAHAGDWRGAEEAAISGLAIDQSLERLWRVRILAAHATRSQDAGHDAIDRMLTIAAQLGGELEAETTALLTGIQDDADPNALLAVAL